MFRLLLTLALMAAASSASSDDDCVGLIGSDADKDTTDAVEVSESVKASVNDGERAFAVNVLKRIFSEFKEDDEKKGRISRNVFISPHSIYQVFIFWIFIKLFLIFKLIV